MTVSLERNRLLVLAVKLSFPVALLFTLAVWTFLIQGALLPFLLVFSGWYVATSLMKTDRAVKTSPESKTTKPREKLAPLNCLDCGAGLTLSEGPLVCRHCGTIRPEPKEYADVFRLRREAITGLGDASRYVRRAARFSSPLLKLLIVALGIWLFALPWIMVIGGETFHQYEPLFQKLGKVTTGMFLGLGLWFLVIFFTAMMITRVQIHLPQISDRSKIGAPESTSCPTCGGALEFGGGMLSTICGFCGVETWRPQVTWRAKKSARADAEKVGHSLTKAKKACEQAIDDLVGTPAIIIYLFVFLPLLIFSPYLLYLAFIDKPALVGGLALLIILLILAIVRWRKRPR